ncbi:MAG: lipoprotein [Oscillospiraceae bacterium]
MKKLIALILALVMTLALAACGGTGGNAGTSPDPQTSETTPTNEPAGDPTAEDVLLEIVHDGDATKITGEAYNEYFDGNALEGVKALLAEGKVYVNGIKVPATEDETKDYQVNGVSSLYKTNAGWGFNVHKTTSADNLSFEDARLGFYETITTVRGHVTTLYGDSATGLVNKIDSQSFDVFRITYFENHGGQVDKIERGDFELETNRVRPDVESITSVSADRFDSDIKVGDVVIYYYGPDGWVMQKAVPMEGTLAKDENKNFVINGGQSNEYVHIESNVSRYNLINCNRPTQFYTAYVRLGLTDLSVVTWCTPTGHPIGFTYGDKAAAKEALALAIEHAAAAKEGVAVSVDGSDVAKGTMWVAQADLDAFDAAIAEAQAVCNKNSTAVQEYDAAIYALSEALGAGGEKPTGFVGAQGEGTQG